MEYEYTPGRSKGSLKRPRKLRPVRRYFVATFTLISCRSNIILNFIYVGKATQINYVNLREIYQHIVEHETQKYATSDLLT